MIDSVLQKRIRFTKADSITQDGRATLWSQTWQDHNQETMISNSQITNMTKTKKKTWQNVKEKRVTDKSGTSV